MRRYERTDLHHPLASNVLTIRQQQLNTGSSSFSNKVSIFHALWQCCGMDLEPNWIRIQLCPWIRIQEGKMAHFIVWSTGCSLLRAEDFSCSLDALYWGLRISKLQFSSIFGHSKPWVRIHIRIGIHLKCWIRIRIHNSALWNKSRWFVTERLWYQELQRPGSISCSAHEQSK